MPKKASCLTYKKRIVSLLNEDETNSAFLTEEIERQYTSSRGRNFCSRALELFVHLSVDEDSAREHWDNIFVNHAGLRKSLQRDVGLRLAAFDYFMNLNRCLDNPILVEIRLFRSAEAQAMVDGLTGLYNRRYFDEHAEKELNRAARHDKRLSVLIFDIDDFKRINDTGGHLFGDEVLRGIGKLLKRSMRKEDIACRYGGDEFVVIMPETDQDGALALASRFRHRVERDPFLKRHDVTISGGIGTFPHDGSSMEAILDRADKGLYKAKFMGKNNIVRETSRSARKRRYKRAWDISYQPLDEAFAHKHLEHMMTEDVSVGGVRFNADEEFPLNTKLLLEVGLPDERKMLMVGKIVWSKRLGKKDFSYGVEFYDLNAEQVTKLKKVLPSNYNIPEI